MNFQPRALKYALKCVAQAVPLAARRRMPRSPTVSLPRSKKQWLHKGQGRCKGAELNASGECLMRPRLEPQAC